MDEEFMTYAIGAAKEGLAEGGIPIGAALVVDGQCLATGHNRRVQVLIFYLSLIIAS
jgi:cytosine/creatinine deaminase